MPLRVGVLGAARITPCALLQPAAERADVEVTVVGGRDRARTADFAAEHGIGRAVGSYADVVEDPDVDIVYNPLPIALHHRWTIAALAAGKHVLCEKPLATNAAEADEMVETASKASLVLCEALHCRYHPIATRIAEIVHGGVLGSLVQVASTFTVTIDPDDIMRVIDAVYRAAGLPVRGASLASGGGHG